MYGATWLRSKPNCTMSIKSIVIVMSMFPFPFSAFDRGGNSHRSEEDSGIGDHSKFFG